jgi:DNA-binding MurR/RpiR family transcriptional regulator
MEELTIEELKLKLAQEVEAKQKVVDELETARETTQRLLEETKRLKQVNADLFARTVAGSQDTTIKKEPATIDEIADTIISKLKNKR